jgi:hypothetical protein
MFKASVIAFTILICGAMLAIAHYDANFAQLPKSVLIKRAAWYRGDVAPSAAKMVRDGLGEGADFSYWQCYEDPAIGSPDGPIAQLDRVTDFYSVGCRFESCWDRH